MTLYWPFLIGYTYEPCSKERIRRLERLLRRKIKDIEILRRGKKNGRKKNGIASTIA